MTNTWRRGQGLTVLVLLLVLIVGMTVSGYAADYTGKTITAINIAGNKAIETDKVMAQVKLKPGDKFEQDKVKQDMQAIYEMGSFYDVVVNFEEVPEGVKITYTVVENPVLTDIQIKGNNKVTSDKLLSMLTVPKGQILNAKLLNENVRAIEGHYHDLGYILAKVSDVAISPEGMLTITINEGMLEGIEVKGNDKTKTNVITREMKVKPGEAFNVKDARRSMQKVYNLGFFEDVNMKLNPGREPNAVVLETSVVEQKTGMFSIGGGYSEADGLVGIIELGDNNFRGTGDKVKVHWEFGKETDNNYELSYTHPWLDSKQTSIGFSFYDMTNEYVDYYDGGGEKARYDKNRKGYELTLGRPEGEYAHNYITFKNRDDKYVEYKSGIDYNKDQQYLEDNFGLTRSVTLMHVRDTRDNIFNPTEGTRYSLSAEFAGKALGGDFNFNKYIAEGRQYFQTSPDHIIALRMTIGYADGKIPDNSRFSVGGADTLRGYEDDQFKGNKMLTATAEYRFPVVKKVQGVVFTDVGKAWQGEGYKLDDLEASIGVGLRVTTPIGPIRLDYAKGKQDSKFHFSFGGQF